MYEKHYKRQRTGYYCGPAVLQILLRARGTHLTQDTIAKAAKTTDAGTSPAHIEAALTKYGLKVKHAEHQTIADLHTALKAGHDVIACITEPAGDGHYILILGFSGKAVRMLDTNDRRKIVTMPITNFEKVWFDKIHTKTNHWAAYVS